MGRFAGNLGDAGGWLDQVADDAQKRALAAPRRTNERDELPGLDREVDVLESRHSAVPGLEDLFDVGKLDCWRGARRRHVVAPWPRRVSAATSMTRTIRKKRTPTSDATMIVAQSFSGPVMYCWLKVRIARPRPC